MEKIDDRWWVIDPEGYLCLHRGVVSVAPGGKGSATSQEALHERFGSAQKWASSTSHLLWKHGFNGAGAWSAVELLRAAEPRLSYTRIWNFMGAYGKRRGGTCQKPGHIDYPNDCIFVFDPAFEAFCQEYASALAETVVIHSCLVTSPIASYHSPTI